MLFVLKRCWRLLIILLTPIILLPLPLLIDSNVKNIRIKFSLIYVLFFSKHDALILYFF